MKLDTPSLSAAPAVPPLEGWATRGNPVYAYRFTRAGAGYAAYQIRQARARGEHRPLAAWMLQRWQSGRWRRVSVHATPRLAAKAAAAHWRKVSR